MAFVTISRETGSFGKEIADLLAARLELPLINRDLVMNSWFPDVATKHELHMLAESPGFFLNPSVNGPTFADYLEDRLKKYIAEQPAIIFGLGGQVIFARHPEALHVKIVASPETRIRRIMDTYSLENRDAERFLELSDRKHKRYITTLFHKDWADPFLYHIILNTDFLSIEEAVDLLFYMTKNKRVSELPAVKTTVEGGKGPVYFKHPSEEEFAKIMDMYGLEWEYEPRTFPIEWDSEGNLTLAFSPDFYLPKFDTYIELTTMNQKYVAEKKKKVQLLRKLYPGTNINIVFKNDFYTLLKRFGMQEGSD